jgi:hypothetical protein
MSYMNSVRFQILSVSEKFETIFCLKVDFSDSYILFTFPDNVFACISHYPFHDTLTIHVVLIHLTTLIIFGKTP